MNTLEANIRDTKTKGELSALRDNGNVPAIIYGGEAQNEKVAISKKLLKSLIEKENFLSNIITLNVDGKTQNVLPKEIKYDIITDEPIHVDFLRVVPGVFSAASITELLLCALPNFSLKSIGLKNSEPKILSGSVLFFETIFAPKDFNGSVTLEKSRFERLASPTM